MAITPDMTADEKWTEWIYLTCECLDKGVTVDELCEVLGKMEGEPSRKAEIIDSVHTIASFWEVLGSPIRPPRRREKEA